MLELDCVVLVGFVHSPSNRSPVPSTIGLLPSAFNWRSSLSRPIACGSVQVAVKVVGL